MSEDIIEHDEWAYSPPTLERASEIDIPLIDGIAPFSGVRNPSRRSSVSHRSFLTYRTAASGWKPRIGITESAAEMAVAHEALLCPDLYDLHFQPLTVNYIDHRGKRTSYTHDLRLDYKNGHRRLVFVRYEHSLLKPETTRAIDAIIAATPSSAADDIIVVNANEYTRQRRENLFRLHQIAWELDREADDVLASVQDHLVGDVFIKDLISKMQPLGRNRSFRACYRAIARGRLAANLDHVISEFSKVRCA